ncbi:cytochrome c oxidase assembly protein [Methylocystis parvus]|uniref:cytochrome c oxidase assembly protein n=1 Tax=Methylocystis parvus TaxID=134 RepID=UPI003C75C039
MPTHESEFLLVRGGGSRCYGRLASLAFAVALIFAGFATWSDAAFAPRSSHMTLHIVTMNAIAPLAAIGWLRLPPARRISSMDRTLVAGLLLQIGVLYAWHLPGVVATAEGRPFFHAAMHIALLGSAILFWVAILSLQGAALWRGFMALILTGKLACLLGALLLLAPGVLDGGTRAAPDAELDDQRFAGLMMLAACPVFYLATAVHMAVRWLKEVEAGAARLSDRRVSKSG